MKSYLKTSSLIFLLFALFSPSYAFAHGDPLFVYSIIGIGAVHLCLAGFLIFSKKIGGLRIPLLGIYFVNMVITWAWAFDFRGPKFTIMYIVLFGSPLFVFLLELLVIMKKTK